MNTVYFQIADIFSQIFYTFLIAEIRHDWSCRSSPLTLLYMQFIGFGLDCFIRSGLRVKIREGNRRYFKIAGITGYCHIFDRLTAGCTGRGYFNIGSNFRIIHIKIIRENNFRILYQLNISITGYIHLNSNRFIRFHIIGTDTGSHCIITDSPTV